LKSRHPRIAFWGNFGTANWGNECTLQAIVHNARQLVPEAELICICSEPADTEKRHGIRAFPISDVRRRVATEPGAMPARLLRRAAMPVRVLRRAAMEAREWVKTLSIARNLDAVVMTGTGMLTDDSEGAFGLPYDLFKWAVLARACGGKVMFASVGVEPILSPMSRFFIVTALRLAEYRSYRDLQSKEHLQRIGFAADRDPVYPDLAFSLPSAMADRGRGGPPGSGRRVAVGIYNYRNRGSGSPEDAAEYRDYLDKIGSFIVWLLDHECTVRVLIGDLAYDEPVLEDVRRWLDDRGVSRQGGRVEDHPAGSVEEVMDQIAEVDVVVASRFHNVLLGLFLGKPVVSISYNEKNDALMTTMGLAKYCQPIDKLDLGRLIEQFSDVLANGVHLRATIAARGSSFRDQLNEQYPFLFGGVRPHTPEATPPSPGPRGRVESKPSGTAAAPEPGGRQ
jgi:polysaccharide pyruvyl transferase WcaK-like protein